MSRLLVLFLVFLIGCASPIMEQLKVDLKYGRIEDAIAHGEEAVAKEPNNPMAHFLLSQAYIHDSRWVDATLELNEAIRLDSVSIMREIKKDASFYYTPYYNAGIEFMKDEDYQQAAKLFTQAIGIDPARPEAYNNLAYTQLRLGDEQEMIATYTKAIELDSTNADAHYNLGFYYTGKGEYENALGYIQKAEELTTPKLREYEEGFFKLFSRELEPMEKKEYLERIMSSEESQKKEILASELKGEDVDRALKILEEIENKAERLGEILSTLGLLNLNAQKEKEAEEILLRALEFSKDNPDTYLYLILALQRQERYKDAFPYLEKMIDLDPSDIRGWFQLGVSHFRTERYEEALETFTKVIELKPDYAGAYDNRGNVYVKKADLMRAKGKTKEEKEFRKLANQDFLKAEALRETEEPE